MLDAHIPGLVYGIVIDGQLVHVGTYGVQDLESKRPVTRDSLFRIASMTKAFTALTVLKLRDDGRLRLDAPAADYVPELRDWKYPTEDTPPLRVRDLLNHVSGFVTDDPWGDRQQPLAEADFTQMLRAGVPFTSAPGTRMEYSNFGYALLGRIITNVSQRPYADTITRTLLQPLGMASSGFDVESGAARTTRARLPLGRRRVAHRAHDGARRVRRDGWIADERQRLREVGGVPAVRLAGTRRPGCRSRPTLDRARTASKARTIHRCANAVAKAAPPPVACRPRMAWA